MRADYEQFLKAYRQPPPPSEIWQEPFDFDDAHYKRLCALDGAMPWPHDVWDYALDLKYQTIQPELLGHILPACLRAWQHNLFNQGNSKYEGFVEQFSPALAHRWPHIRTLLKPGQADTVTAFMRDSILDAIDRETTLPHQETKLYQCAWASSLCSFAVVFPSLETLWDAWWRFETPGQAIAALKYISVFMYEAVVNPVFESVVTLNAPDGGGNPFAPWDPDGSIDDECWQPENVAYFKSTVTPDFIRDALARARDALRDVTDSGIPAEMLADFDCQEPLLRHRVKAFLEFVSQPLGDAPSCWPPLP